MRKSIALLLFVFVSFKAIGQKDSSATMPSVGLTVFPASVNFELDRGGTQTKIINVKNTTKKTYQLNTSLIDWSRDTVGEHVYQEPGTMEHSCAKWVSFDKNFIELKPGDVTTVAITMKVPDSAGAVNEMKWAMLLIKTASEKVTPLPNVKLAMTTNQVFALGVHVYQTPPNITNKEIKMLSFSEMPGRSYRIVSKNIGGVQLQCKYTLELTSEQTGAKTSLNSKTIPLFPKQDRYVDFTLPDTLPKGKYTVVAMIDADDDAVPIEAVQKEIVVK